MNKGTFRPRDILNKEVAGICGVARMTDKARAVHKGSIGRYKYGNDSEQDTTILAFLGISVETFQETAVRIENDVRLGTWILDNCEVSDADISNFNTEMQTMWHNKRQHPSFSNRRREIVDDPPFPWWISPGWWMFWKLFK